MFNKIIDDLIDALKTISTITNKSAQKIAFDLLKKDNTEIDNLVKKIYQLKQKLTFCTQCNFLMEIDQTNLCQYCSNPKRNQYQICIVTSLFEAFKIENAKIYHGLYYILDQELSIKKRENQSHLKIDKLIVWLKKIASENSVEIIIATNPTIDGQLTAHELAKSIHLINSTIKIYRLGFGLPYNSEINYADDLSLEQSLNNKQEIKIIRNKT